MNGQIKNLANLMRAKRDSGEPFVVMLGAGASLSSGVPPTQKIKEDLLQKHAAGILPGASTDERFDELWRHLSNDNRGTLLKPYLDLQPSNGYRRFGALIEAGYFSLILTFNFDNLLEKALQAMPFTDFKTVIRGETVETEMRKLVEVKEPRVKLVKLHGSLRSSNHFLFAPEEIYEYPPAIKSLVRDLTARDIIVCGYSFGDVCVIDAFNKDPAAGSIVCVNPGGVPGNLRGLLPLRRSQDLSVKADFDRFFEELHRELLEAKTAAPPGRPRPNPFKFLESYGLADADAFKGRDEEIGAFQAQLAKDPPAPVVIVAGPGKAGKTSLVRAGVLARLDPGKYWGIYLRCQSGLEKTLPAELHRTVMAPADADPAAALRWLVERARDRHVVVVLDQFERATSGLDLAAPAGKRALADFLRSHLFAALERRLTLVLVVTDVDSLGYKLAIACEWLKVSPGLVECPALGSEAVADIVRLLARTADMEFEASVIGEMTRSYEQTRNAPSPERRFTLAHVQAICHMLTDARRGDQPAYEAFKNDLEALHQAINGSDIISFVEDCPWPDTVWIRNMIKVPLRTSKDQIAAFIKQHYQELLPQQEAPGTQRRRSSGAA